MESQFILTAALLALGGAITSLPAQLDLNPQPGVCIGEGTPFPCIRFRDGDKVVRFMPPHGWRFTADGRRCSFHPAGVALASGTFAAQKPAEESDADPAARLQQLVREKLPAEAVGVEVTTAGLPALKLDRWTASHAQATYEHFGQKFRVALLVARLDGEELHIRFGSRAADFDHVFLPLLESLGTFTWNPTDEDAPKQKEAAAARR
jgi:hypothetical protein